MLPSTEKALRLFLASQLNQQLQHETRMENQGMPPRGQVHHSITKHELDLRDAIAAVTDTVDYPDYLCVVYYVGQAQASITGVPQDRVPAIVKAISDMVGVDASFDIGNDYRIEVSWSSKAKRRPDLAKILYAEFEQS